MRVFLAGASGVIGVRLVPLLVEAGHEVAGMTRSPGKRERLRGLGAEPVVCDAFDAAALRQAVVAFAPEAVVNERPTFRTSRRRKTRRTRACGVWGTRNLLAAGAAAGASRLFCNSTLRRVP